MKFLPILFSLLLCSPSFAALSGVQPLDAVGVVVPGPTQNQYKDATASAKAVSNLALTSNIVTLTITAHGFVVGETITVALLAGPVLFADCNGSFTVASVVDANTITYSFTHADIVTGAATGTATGNFESPIATDTSLVKLVWPANATRLYVTTSAVCNISKTATVPAPGSSGSFQMVAGVIYEINGKPGDITYIFRTNSSIINFRFAILN